MLCLEISQHDKCAKFREQQQAVQNGIKVYYYNSTTTKTKPICTSL